MLHSAQLIAITTCLFLLSAQFASGAVKISEADYEGRAQYRVETASATYYFDRAGGGFSRIIDLDGNDWVAFHKEPLKQVPESAAAGFRGVPNLVHGKDNPDAGAGHPGFDKCDSDIVGRDAIRTRSKSGNWEWEWKFTDESATLTVLKVDPNHRYWFLYEGPVGGRWSPKSHFFGTDQHPPIRETPGSRQQVTRPFRWAYFGDDHLSRVLLVCHRNEDEFVDNFWYLGASNQGIDSEDGMVVFGFGRDLGSKPLMRDPGQQFRLGFIESSHPLQLDQVHQEVSKKAQAWLSNSDWPEVTASRGVAAQGITGSAGSVSKIKVSDEVLFGDMDCYRIETPTATYLYGKKGAGFASILDPDGHDWISYRHGQQSKGEYRGLPKSGQPTKLFHCGFGYGQYKTENPFDSRVEKLSPSHVRVSSTSSDGLSACTWDFYSDHATMTLERIANPAYWFLYEGTPGGELNVETDFVVRPGNRQTNLNEPWLDDVSWVYFGANESPFAFFLIDHQNDPGPDSYVSWPYKPDAKGHFQQMTVFGFGRPAWNDPAQHTPPLTQLPARFSLGFTPSQEYAVVESVVKSIVGK